MLYYYQGKRIGNDSSEIAASYRFKSNTSGRDLRDFWNDNASSEAIKRKRTKSEATHFINKIEGIIPMLNPSEAEKAVEDIEIIKNSIVKKY